MADEDRHDPNDTGEELDLSEFYRDGGEIDPRRTARTTNSVDIRNYYRTEAEREAARTTSSLHIEDYLRTGHDPAALHDYDVHGWQPEDHLQDHPEAGVPAVQTPAPPPAETGATTDVDPLSIAAEAEAEHDASAAGSAGAGPPPPPPPPAPAVSPIYRFASIGALLGIIFAAAAIMLSWVFSKPAGPYDLGIQTLAAVGLKGRLYTKWEDKQLQYRLSFEPSDKDYGAGFSWVAGNPPRPLAIEVQLKDAMGFVLCSRNILLPFDPVATAQTAQDIAHPGQQTNPPPDLDQLKADEARREHGQELFQLQTGSSGQVESIAAQGEIPCSEQAYEKVVSWSFTPDFPSLAEQNDLMRQPEIQAAARAAALRRRASTKKVQETPSFAIEGDNVLVGYDASSGALETSSGSPFYVDRDSAALTQPGWQTFPIHIHYRCDSVTGCTLTRVGSAVQLRARMKK